MNDIEKRIENFKLHLRDNSYSELEIVRKFICFGIPYVFKDNEENYYKLKVEVAKKFNIHPNEVLMVGSGKLGFSLAPGDKRWQPFGIESDIDIAIISNKAFDFFWQQLREFEINLQPRNVKEDEDYQQFLLYFFKGWLRPDKFNFKFPGKIEWFAFFNELKPKIFKNRKYDISAGIYKDFESFEHYHCKNIKKIRTSIKGE